MQSIKQIKEKLKNVSEVVVSLPDISNPASPIQGEWHFDKATIFAELPMEVVLQSTKDNGFIRISGIKSYDIVEKDMSSETVSVLCNLYSTSPPTKLFLKILH